LSTLAQNSSILSNKNKKKTLGERLQHITPHSPHMSQEEGQDHYRSFQLGKSNTRLKPLGNTKTKTVMVINQSTIKLNRKQGTLKKVINLHKLIKKLVVCQ